MDEEDEDEECQLWDEAFTEWLEIREPTLHDLATNFFNWCPTPGMLDNCYLQYTKEATNANALRQVLAARTRGDDMRQWQEWTQKHLDFFTKQGVQTMPNDIRAAYGEGAFCTEWGAPTPSTPTANVPQNRRNTEAGRAQSRSRSPVHRAEDDKEDKPRKEAINGPYLEPETTDGPYKLLRMQGKYEYNMEREAERMEYQSATAREVPSDVDGVYSHRRRIHLQHFLLAIGQHKNEWKRFPEIKDYFAMVESNELVEVEHDEGEDTEET